MKKAKSESNDWGRAEYKRTDLGELVRGKYAKRLNKSSNVVILDPERKTSRQRKSSDSYYEIVRRLFFHLMIKRGLKDSDAGRTISN